MTTTSGSVREALEAMETHIQKTGPAWRVWNVKKKR